MHYLVTECNQDVSKFSKNEQRVTQDMIEEHKSKSKVKNDPSLGITDSELDFDVAFSKIKMMNVELTSLHINFVLGGLFAKKWLLLTKK